MKLVELGVCIDNNDPKGVGRIRCVRYSDFVSEKEKAFEYEPFSKDDVFLANPFLPLNINVLPKVGQAVKIINYDTSNETINTEYIIGPFSDLSDINEQTFSSQVENTTYGNTFIEKKDIFDKKGNYRNEKSKGFHHEKDDYGIYGKNSSDLVFQKNGILLRGNKLVGNKDKNDLVMSKNIPRIHINKFSNQLVKEEVKTQTTISDIGDVKTLVEYEINDFNNISRIDFFIYINLTNDKKFKTDVFSDQTEIDNKNWKSLSKNNLPIYTISVDSPLGCSIEINNFIYNLFNNKDLKKIFKNDYVVDFPLYFRPTSRNRLDTSNIPLKKEIFNKINFFGNGSMSGLIWSRNQINPSSKVVEEIKTILKPNESKEESFTTAISDKIFLLSSDTNKTDKNVDVLKLGNYDLTHEELKQEIDGNTYSVVRGENLIRLLKSMIDVLFTHEHNLIGPMVKNENYDKYVELTDYVKKMENDLLNKSIKIN